MEGPPKGTAGRRKRILSIDGGGVRGLVPSQILEYLEKCLQDLDGPSARIAHYFDLISGTSTGGLIALMLATPDKDGRPMFTAKQITEFYLKNSRAIFRRNMLSTVFGPKFSAEPLEKLLKSYLGDLKMQDTIVPVLIPSFDIKLQQPTIFTTSEALVNPSKNALLRHVARATSAAPTYFPPVKFETTEGTEFHMVDGGLAANNPCFLAVIQVFKDSEAQGRSTPRTLFQKFEDLLVLSLGCGNQTVSYTAAEASGWGTLSWVVNRNGPPITNMLLNASSDMVDHAMAAMFHLGLCENNFLRIQTPNLEGTTAEVDNASRENLAKLVHLGKQLLKEPVQRINPDSGTFEQISSGRTNEEAIMRFAKWLSEERKQSH